MKIKVLTLFPGLFEGAFTHSMLKRASEQGFLDVELIDIRAFTQDKHRRADDYPFGGGAGLVMSAQPVISAAEHALTGMGNARRICLSPRGSRLDQSMARELSGEGGLLLLCGHYEGIDQRALDYIGFEDVSIGDYVLTGGELAAMVLIDCVTRLIPGVLDDQSTVEESFNGDALEYPQYTRPSEFMGMSVPEVLLGGHHAHITAWRRLQSLRLTLERRPDLASEGMRRELEALEARSTREGWGRGYVK